MARLDLKEIVKEAVDEVIEDLKSNTIMDVDNFKMQLKREGLMTAKLNEFIENYMRWDNS